MAISKATTQWLAGRSTRLQSVEHGKTVLVDESDPRVNLDGMLCEFCAQFHSVNPCRPMVDAGKRPSGRESASFRLVGNTSLCQIFAPEPSRTPQKPSNQTQPGSESSALLECRTVADR
jgi:hypothetical protein